MKTRISTILRRFVREEKGATLVEYGAAIAVVLIATVAALSPLGEQVVENFGAAETAITPEGEGAD